jgi:sec-independent protein translocase protein TatA
MFGLGMPELLIVLVIAIVIFGPSKLPSLGKGIGEAIRGLKKGLEEPSREDDNTEKQENKKIEK